MPTNDERCEVAAKLRAAKTSEIENAVWLAFESIGANDGRWRIGFLAELIEPEPERTCTVKASGGQLYDVYVYSCCGYEHAESMTDGCATDLPLNYCPNCGAKVVENEQS